MADLFDYVHWRGDVEFSYSPFNEVDALILCQISYMNFDELIPENFDEQIEIGKLAEQFKNSSNIIERKNLGMVINPKTNDFFEKLAESKRFQNIKLCGWKNKYSEKTEEQFLAYTAFIEDFALITFRGTDDTIIGWKEDFNLAFEEGIQAQKDALKYLNDFSEKNPKMKIRVAGHSKGGNLAIYSGAKTKNQTQIDEIYNFDGPGFSKSELESEKFQKARVKIKSFYPQCSIIGMLFEHFPECTIVESTEKLIMQHDPMSWQILPTNFKKAAFFDKKSVFIERTFNSWYMELPKEKRTQFVESIFEALFASSAKNFSDFTKNWEQSFQGILKNFWEQNPKIKKSNLKIVGELFNTARKELFKGISEKLK